MNTVHCTTTGAHKDTHHQKTCCKVVAIVHSSSNQQLLCSRFGAMCDGNLREAIKLWTYNSEWVQNSTSTQEYDSNRSIRKLGAWCLRNLFTYVFWQNQRAHDGWRETLHATDCAHRPTQMDPRRGVRSLHQEGMPKLVGFGHGTVSYLVSRFPHFHFQKLHFTVTGDNQQ